ncbi:MAG TPA: hypothetical protein PKD64_08500 [Pirellulaceae bacterium]|nr:hypothetical protein [Pirellulaceae bacterium]HMO92226.1 hypothetical protein [Pirellulaceae bacterium]HMP70735.1 hypothetical protein [Pirellulaceae bacterium]
MDTTLPHNKRTWSTRVAVFSLLAIVIAPIVFYGCQHERLLWQMAALSEEYRKSDKQAAIEAAWQLHLADPSDTLAASMLANWLVETQQPLRALEICEKFDGEEQVDYRLNRVRIAALRQLGRYDEALQFVKKNGPIIKAGNWFVQNSHRIELSYNRALANTELPAALSEIQLVINGIVGSPDLAELTLHMGEDVFVRFVAAVVSLDGSNYERAKKILSDEIDFLSARHARLSRQTESRARRLHIDSIFGRDVEDWVMSGYFGNPEGEIDLERTKSELVILTALRAKIWQLLGNHRAALADISYVQQKDHDPQVVLNRVQPGRHMFRVPFRMLCNAIAARACIYSVSGEFTTAKRDFDTAIMGLRTFDNALRQYRLFESDPLLTDRIQMKEVYEQSPKRNLAWMLYRRSLLLRTLNRNDEADADEAEIRSLGFEPGPSLDDMLPIEHL